MTRPVTAKSLTEGRHKDLSSLINCPPLWVYPAKPERRTSNGEPFWTTGFDALMTLAPGGARLRGEFEMRSYWRYWDIPEKGGAELRESSISINVSEHGFSDRPHEICIARYDFENYGLRRGRHLNVYQPVVSDSVHWVTPGPERTTDWSFQEVLDWLFESLADELLGAGWPST